METNRLENISIWIILILVASALTAKKIVTLIKSKSDFKKILWPLALEEEKRTGIKPNLLIGQAALESGSGMSLLTRNANNLFGMVAGSNWIKAVGKKLDWSLVAPWTILPGDAQIPPGRAVEWMPTKEHSDKPPEQIQYWEMPGDIMSKEGDGKGGTWLMVKRPFRKYFDFGESIKDWGNKISTMPRYAAAYGFAKEGDARNFGLALKSGGYATDPKYPEKVMASIQSIESIPIEATA